MTGQRDVDPGGAPGYLGAPQIIAVDAEVDLGPCEDEVLLRYIFGDIYK